MKKNLLSNNIDYIILLEKEYWEIIEKTNLSKRNKKLLYKIFLIKLPLKKMKKTKNIGKYIYGLMYQHIKNKFPNNFKILIKEFIFLKDVALKNTLNECLNIRIKIKKLNKF